MKRRRFVSMLGVVLAYAVHSTTAFGQKSAALPRIGLLVPGPGASEPGFMEGMRELGYVDGKNVVFERRSAEGDFAKLPALAAELVRTKPDVIVSFVTQACAAIYVQKILRGAKAGDLASELPRQFETVVNLKTGNAIGLAVPASVIARADEVIR